MFYSIGLITLAYVAFTILKQLYVIFQMATNPADFDMRKYGGQWCLITGCTDGIGEFHGFFDIVLFYCVFCVKAKI